MLYANILETIGNTPMVKLNQLAPDGVNIWCKLESHNPMGSVKDRIALAIIEDAERRGVIKPGQTVVEATSGNTGIGLAMVCAAKGYPLVVTMAESFSIERRKLLRFLGAKVVLTPASEKGTGMKKKAEELAEQHGYFMPLQFENQANPDAHYRTTAREILDDFGDTPIHAWVSGFGTGGTLQGVSRALREETPATRVVVAEPDNAALLGSGVPQAVDERGIPTSSHPHFRPHLMQGWTPDFISSITQHAIDADLIDELLPVNGIDAMAASRLLARKEGIFVGISAGATLAAALEVARSAPEGANIVVMLPDTGERYLSTPLFGEINEEMNEEELSLSTSTPGYRFDTETAAAAAAAPVSSSADAVAFVEKVVTEEPVVMFALEWCEFCWSLRKLFDALNVPFRSIDIDSVGYQADNWGVKVRQALHQRLDIPTIPQVFVGGEHLGGCTEVIKAYHDGSLLRHFDNCGFNYRRDESINAWSFMPQWLHSRYSA